MYIYVYTYVYIYIICMYIYIYNSCGGVAQLVSTISYKTRAPWFKTSCGYGREQLLQFIPLKETLIVLFLFLERMPSYT